jgi:L-fuconolactonase
VTVIDAHLHMWNLERVRYPWLTAEYGPLFRTFEQGELEPQLAVASIDKTVLVQSANSREDTDFMLAVADGWPRVTGVVGWVPLDRPDEAAAALDRRCADPRFVGVRHLIHIESDPDWVLRSSVQRGLGLLARRGVTFDVVTAVPRHLANVMIIADRHPDLRIVIDHLGRPPIKAGGWLPWSDLLAGAAARPNVFAKLSGLNTAADPETWTAADLRPYVDRALELFGPRRLMYGGDWPITTLAGGYVQVWQAIKALLAPLSQSERDHILGGTALEFYRPPL